MKFLFLAPLPSAFGEALHGARLASALVDRGHTAHFAAPTPVAATVSDPRVAFVPIDEALPRLDREIEALVAQLGVDVLVLVDAAAVDKAARALRLSIDRIASAAPRVVSIDCWNLVSPPARWDYGPIAEPLDPALLARTTVIRPVPIARAGSPGGYAALPAVAAPTREQRADTRRSFGLPDGNAVIVWPTARWQLPESHDHPALAQIATRLHELVVAAFAALGGAVTIVHVSPSPIAALRSSPAYRQIAQLPASRFEALVGASDVLLSFNAAATSLATAVSLGVPIALGVARGSPPSPPLWAWPLSLDGVLAPTVRDNPFYATMTRLDPADTGELVGGLRTLLFDAATRERIAAAQASYRDSVARLPSGAELVLGLL